MVAEEEKQFARRFEVVVVRPLPDGHYMVLDRETGKEKYEINEEVSETNMKKSKDCKHEEFSGEVEVGIIENKNPIEHVVTVKIHCIQCGLPFAFDEDHFAVSADRLTLRYKLKPSDGMAFAAGGGKSN